MIERELAVGEKINFSVFPIEISIFEREMIEHGGFILPAIEET